MKNYLQTFAVLCLFLMAASCMGQDKTGSPREALGESLERHPERPTNKAEDVDPYFTESTAITSTSGPNSITRNMLQDRKGHMWFATWEGIIGYDGKTFTNYMNKEGLRRYHTFAVLEDRSGDLWFGTIGAGVYRYNGTTFTNFTTQEGLANDRIGLITEDKNGTIWIGTEKGISCYDGTSFRNFTAAEGLMDGDVNSIIQDQAGQMWIGTRGTSYVYDGKTFAPLTNQDGLTFQNVRSIIEDRKGNIWLGGNDGLWRYDGTHYTQLSTNFTGYLYEARDGHIWVSAVDGPDGYDMTLYRVEEGVPPNGQDHLTPVKDVNGQVFGIVEDKAGDIWFGTQRGACRYDGKTFHYYKD